jgi:hypothetical protein
MLDPDEDGDDKFVHAFVDGQPSGNLDNVTLNWLTGTGVWAARFYWEAARAQALAVAAGNTPPEVKLLVGFTVFPGEILRAPRSWVEQQYSNLIDHHQAHRGGHFGAWEEPELFSEEIRAAFR